MSEQTIKQKARRAAREMAAKRRNLADETGFGLYQGLMAVGIRCEVVAPSKLQKPAGDRVKTDAKDAIHLAKLLRLDEITSVSIPSIDQEAARDLVRAREDCRGDLIRARHRLSKLLCATASSTTAVVRGPRPSIGGQFSGVVDIGLVRSRVAIITFHDPPVPGPFAVGVRCCAKPRRRGRRPQPRLARLVQDVGRPGTRRTRMAGAGHRACRLDLGASPLAKPVIDIDLTDQAPTVP